MKCVNCGGELSGRQRKYCSDSCKREYKKEAALSEEKVVSVEEDFGEVELATPEIDLAEPEVEVKSEEIDLAEPEVEVPEAVELAEPEAWNEVLIDEPNWPELKADLVNRHGANCMRCGFSERNVHNNGIVLKVGFDDGNSENLEPGNLVLLCPNCFAINRI